MSRHRFVFIALCLLACIGPSLHAQADRSSPKAVLGFADWLFSQGEYARAAGEYYRYLYFAPDGEKAAVLRRIGASYFKAREYRQAILAFEKLIAAHPQSPLVEEAYYEAAYCSFKLGEYDAASAQLNRDGRPALPPPALLLDGTSRLLDDDWNAARGLFTQYLAVPAADQADWARELLNLTEEAMAAPARSGVAAGLLSVLIPGAGKMYAGRWEDGLFSLVLCGLFGGLAAYSFATEGAASVKAWIYTAIGGIFYIGNIYGSVVAAEQFIEIQRADLKRRMVERANKLFP